MKIYKISAITDGAKERLRQHHQIIDEKNIGGYDIVLIKVVPLNIYQIGLQQENLDFTDVPSQMQKIKPETSIQGIKKLLEDLKGVINAWKDTYRKLYIISTNESKQEKFKNVLSKMGYVLQEENIMGKRVFFI
jgi:hypothetical protein